MLWYRGAPLVGLLCALLAGSAGAAKADKPNSPRVHLVKPGQTLSRIALQYKVSVAQLRQWNELRGDRIYKGQRLELWPGGPPEHYTVKRGDTLSGIAARFGLSLAELRRLNTVARDRIHPGQKLKLRARSVGTEKAGSSPGSATHRVRRGDTLSEIAAAHGLTVPRLRELNELRGDIIAPGQLLKTTAPAKPESTEELQEYVVKRGDTLSGIAHRFDVGLALLRQLNRLKGDRIHPGQKLKLRPAVEDEGIHMVRPGETLSGIAVRYRVPLDDLREINGIEGSRILVGQKLRLKRVPTATHIVERGDALWELARAYGMSVAALKKLNGLSSDRIYPGQELKLNVQGARRFEWYTVEKGDYLGQIARLHQMSVSELKKLNKLGTSVIHPGNKLKVRPLLGRGSEWLKVTEINWDELQVSKGGVRKIQADNGPYYYTKPRAARQKSATYYESYPKSPLRTYEQARKLFQAFEREIDGLGRLSTALKGWHVVLDPGHGGQDPGAVVTNTDGKGNKLYVVEDEYMYDIAMRVYVLLRLHGARVTMTLLSPNHLIRHTVPPSQTFVNEKNEVYNSYALNKRNRASDRPRGGKGGNLESRVRVARDAFAGTSKSRRIFLSFHADIDRRAPEAPLVLYYESGRRQDLASRSFARALLPALGAGARTRGQDLGVLRDNPAAVKVLVELRNLAYTDHVWALRFERLRHRDAEKLVKGVLDYARRQDRSARR